MLGDQHVCQVGLTPTSGSIPFVNLESGQRIHKHHFALHTHFNTYKEGSRHESSIKYLQSTTSISDRITRNVLMRVSGCEMQASFRAALLQYNAFKLSCNVL